MKKITLLVLVLATFLISSAQTPLTTAVDFTATDVEGHEVNLFEILDGGQYVLIDFFYTTCGPCQIAAPKVNEVFHYFGCNSGDVVFLAIDNGDTDAECIAFDETYGVEYPTISGVEGGGNAICSAYGIGAYPTIVLIAPDHSIAEQDIWPIATPQVLIDALEVHGLSQNECYVGISDNTNELAQLNIYPNPATSVINIDLQNSNENIASIKLIDLQGKVIKDEPSFGGKIKLAVSDIRSGLYFIIATTTTDEVITKKVNIRR
jgi:thiol-disulfide isomerase/thioredoxin